MAVIGTNANYSEGDTGYYGPHNVCGGKYWNGTALLQCPSPLLSLASLLHCAFSDFPSLQDIFIHVGRVVVDAVSKHATKTTTAPGGAAAVALAKTADTVVVVIGTQLGDASEGHDAESIALHPADAKLVADASAAAKKPIIVITMTAVPLDISALMTSAKVGAVLHVGQPSVTVLGVSELLVRQRAIQLFSLLPLLPPPRSGA